MLILYFDSLNPDIMNVKVIINICLISNVAILDLQMLGL